MKTLYILLISFCVPLCFAEDAPASEAPAQAESPAVPAGEAELPAAAEPDSNGDGAAQTAGATGRFSIFQRFGIAAGIVFIQGLLIWAVWILFRWLTVKALKYGEEKFRPIAIKKFRLLSKEQMLEGCAFLLRIAKYALTAFQLFITVPIIFTLFEFTRDWASTLFSYILAPLKTISLGIVSYIPNLITIIIILFIMRYVLRTLRYFALGLERGRLTLPGFYPEWAQPTFNILRVLIYAFTIAVVYPYLPGSDSAIFQGVSVFVGIIFSLGSSSAIGNVVAGLVITYMRPFKIGDRIRIGDITGFVVEKSPIVIRLRTHKNEYVTIPNVTVLSSSTINYNTSQDIDEEGLLLHADVTMNYCVPWRKMHEILIEAALKTPYTMKQPKPFVLQTALDDYYCRYEINVYTKEVNRVPAIYSTLYQNLQDGCAEAGIDLTAPAYQIRLSERNPSEIISGEPLPSPRRRRSRASTRKTGT
ncbi:MAG: mechanosensitive ion channel family protein [Spirochaetales bacterium]|jgi:small-conductance mechanosensitive channel|nr:mechanosensitive ion channel family protein [Spirochaetales bacterium]